MCACGSDKAGTNADAGGDGGSSSITPPSVLAPLDALAIRVDSNNVYVRTVDTSAQSTIWSVPKSGGSAVVLSSEQSLATASLAIDAANVYYADQQYKLNSMDAVLAVPKSGGTGSATPLVLDPDAELIDAVGVDSSGLYFLSTDYGELRSTTTGSNAAMLSSQRCDARQFVLDDTQLYCTDSIDDFSLVAIPKAGGSGTALYSDSTMMLPVPTDLVTDGTALYVATYTVDTSAKATCAVDRIDKTGSAQTIASVCASALAIDGDSLLMATFDGSDVLQISGAIESMPLAGGTPTVLTAAVQTDAIAADAGFVYFSADYGSGFQLYALPH